MEVFFQVSRGGQGLADRIPEVIQSGRPGFEKMRIPEHPVLEEGGK